MATRLGVVSYLNTKPLVHGFESGELDHDFELHYDVPSVCADKLHAGNTDVALIPSIEIARSETPYKVAPGVGICSLGPVRSVFLILTGDPGKISSLALDRSSRTSVVLSQIVLQRVYGRKPTVCSLPPDLDQMLDRADAALLIGDPALELDLDRYQTIDLWEAWTDMTGLPFVYACWTGRTGALSQKQVGLLNKARDAGVRKVGEIASAFAQDRLLSPGFYTDYLRQSIRFVLGEAELEAMRRFFSYAHELDLIPRVPELHFYSA